MAGFGERDPLIEVFVEAAGLRARRAGETEVRAWLEALGPLSWGGFDPALGLARLFDRAT